MDNAKLALIIAAVNPSVGGVLLKGDKGTGKTTLVRSFADVLPEYEAVADCPFQCNPRDPQLMCDSCYARYQRGESLPVVRRKMRVVDLPLSVTVDRLVGTLDIKRALTEGVRALQPGLLAEANRNVLYIDEVNLLDDYIIDVLLDVVAYGWNVVEREGVSVRHPARFILVASMNPEEGELRPQLLDRFGLVVDVEAPQDPEVRAEIVRRVEEFSSDPEGFYRKWEPQIAELRAKIQRATELVSRVEIPEDLLKFLAETVVNLRIRTSRAEITTVRAAKALAALDGRTRVTMEDLQKAMELTLPHRLKSKPFERPRTQPQRQQPAGAQGSSSAAEGKGDRGGTDGTSPAPRPNDLVAPPSKVEGQVNLWLERARQSKGLPSRAALKREIGKPSGVPYMYLPAYSRELSDVDVVGTIVTAALRGHLPKVEMEDIAVRVRKARAPRVSIVLLDSSGSMNFMKRIELAKGLVREIAEQSYVKRAYVGLVTFRGEGVDRVIYPTRNYWKVLEELEGVPSGGATPLPLALAYTYHLIKGLKQRLKGDYWVYVITDGKANVSLEGKIDEEIERYTSELTKLARIIVYDTRPNLSFDPSLSFIDLLSKYAVRTERI